MRVSKKELITKMSKASRSMAKALDEKMSLKAVKTQTNEGVIWWRKDETSQG